MWNTWTEMLNLCSPEHKAQVRTRRVLHRRQLHDQQGKGQQQMAVFMPPEHAEHRGNTLDKELWNIQP